MLDKFQEFFLCKGKFRTFDLAASTAMTFMGAEIILSIHPFHRHGLFSVLAFSSVSVALILFALFFSSQIAKKNILTIGDLAGDVWGYKSKFFCGLLIVCNCSIIAALQMSVLNTILESLYRLPFYFNKIISVFIVIGYSLCGGISAMIAMQKTQFFILSFSLLVLLCMGIFYIGGLSEFIKYSESGHVSYAHDSDYYVFIFCLSCSLGVILSPPLIQRALMARSPSQAIKSSCFSAFLLVPLVVGLGLVSFVFHIFMNVICPGRSLIEIFEMIPVFLRGLVVLNILAIIISTADSALNCGGASLINDVIFSFNPNNRFSISMKVVKFSILTVGVISAFISTQIEDLLKVLTYSNMLWVSMLVPPLIGLLLDKTVSSGEFAVCVIVGGLVLLLWNMFLVDGSDFIEGIFLGFLSNFLTYSFFYLKRNFYKFRIFLNKLF